MTPGKPQPIRLALCDELPIGAGRIEAARGGRGTPGEAGGRGQTFRFATTHLDPVSGAAQVAQANKGVNETPP
jgi:hypothetical protein